MIVPVTNVSRLTDALSEALSLGDEVVAVSVVVDHGEAGRGDAGPLEREWADWDSGRAAADAADRVRVGGRADRRVHRRGSGTDTTSRSWC